MKQTLSEKKIIVIKAKKATTILEKITGLIGTTNPYPLLIHTRWGIHTFGMKYPIDILILDRKNCVMKMHSSLSPNRIFVWNPKYHWIIELPSGSVQKMNIKQGDYIELASL